ncbi:unnamed protein product [Brassicogethes aeneus]|uniref:MYND-type domain-containing protein n=1 Tax=Brassicogethes aeneus TaxID=1431903 RepID=A0A9P0FEA6_BRAAE|nr:unnamed protein product [Brassicogethes aeneus]
MDPTHSPSEASEIFLPNDIQPITGNKRRPSDSIYENGLNGQPPPDSQDYLPPVKRPAPQNAFMFPHQHSLFLPNTSASVPNSQFFEYGHHTSAHQTQRNEDNNTGNRGDEEALTILQQRNNQELTAEWLRKQDVSVDLKKAANEIMVQAVRQTEDRVAEVKRRAEDASCWNCGRKAHETCSGCSLARYCGAFCQHKDWENHHQVCSKEKIRPIRVSTPSSTVQAVTDGKYKK